jgi:hypothetical protein
MDQDAQASLVDAWGKSLLKATKNAKTDAKLVTNPILYIILF